MNTTYDAFRKEVTIESIETFAVHYPTVMRFKFFEGPLASSGRPAILIKITADNGVVGWGESVPIPRWGGETWEGTQLVLERYFAPLLSGRNPFDIEALHAEMDREMANAFSTAVPMAKAGLDIALHDLMGKLAGENIAQLWGRSLPERLLLSWTLNPRTLDDIEPLIAQGRARGYEHFNVKVAPDLEFDQALCSIVKERVPEGFLWADANGGYDVDTALEVAPKLAALGVPVLEQPVRPNCIPALQQLKQQGALPIILDEGVVSPRDLETFIALECLDGVAMKPARCGGLLSARAQIELLEKHNLLFLGSGLTDPDVSLAASLVLYGAYGLSYPAALNGPQFLGDSVLKTPFEVADGYVQIPQGPGLGIEVDEEKVRALAAGTPQYR